MKCKILVFGNICIIFAYNKRKFSILTRNSQLFDFFLKMFSFIKTCKYKEFSSLREFSIYTSEIKLNSFSESSDVVLIKLLGN
jgi:hypothetical protein